MSDGLNPYAPPAEWSPAPTEDVPTQRLVMAGRGVRFANLIIDYVAQLVVAFMLGVALVLFGGEAGADWIEGTNDFVVGICTLLAYYFVLEATTSRTLGKLLTGTRVVGPDGRPASVGRIAIRTLSRLIPFEPFSFFGKGQRGWHDSISETYVVKAR